ncbi:hypothetical protein CB0940_00576 [Cercospora beticola]|uniref:Uncharacterized protein n=1 Tax=Cercospora beticola TaxID=122368 RepID=A0A2G5IB31_CERBT|nr:hypothetical protein CB0940_00576 [Cercospora beticola]PIB02066.1 hypothetical protein CB0940_00576 [Cercospora beticola]
MKSFCCASSTCYRSIHRFSPRLPPRDIRLHARQHAQMTARLAVVPITPHSHSQLCQCRQRVTPQREHACISAAGQTSKIVTVIIIKSFIHLSSPSHSPETSS